MIASGVLAIEYGASSEDIARTSHAHVRRLDPVWHSTYGANISHRLANSQRGIQGSCYGRLRQRNPCLIRHLIFSFFFDVFIYLAYSHSDVYMDSSKRDLEVWQFVISVLGEESWRQIGRPQLKWVPANETLSIHTTRHELGMRLIKPGIA